MPAPVASFTTFPATLYTNEPVFFTDTSTNVPTSWLWDFGDGVTSTQRNPDHTYTTPGSKTVSLTVTNDSGSNTHTTGISLNVRSTTQPELLTYRYYPPETPSTGYDLFAVGLASDGILRGLYELPGELVLAVTETGAFLYKTDGTLVNQIRITDRMSSLISFSDLSTTWASEACGVPVYHVNVNLLSDGRAPAYGFLVVRRGADVALVESTPAGGVEIRVYRVWNIHFDPVDLSAPGPVVGQFHWRRNSLLPPGVGTDQEVVWMDGCSEGALDYSHGDGYISRSSPFLGAPVYGVHGDVPSRFWDSLAVFRVNLNVGFYGEVTGNPALTSSTYLPAYLIYVNAGSRGLSDPLMKLREIRFVGMPPVSDPNDSSFGDGSLGARFRNYLWKNQMPLSLAYDGGSPGSRNYLYTNVFDAPGLRDNPPKIPGFQAIPPHGIWLDYVALNFDVHLDTPAVFGSPAETPYLDWGFENFGASYLGSRDEFLGGMGVVRRLKSDGRPFVPGVFCGAEMQRIVWSGGLGIPKYQTGDGSTTNDTGKGFCLVFRAAVALSWEAVPARQVTRYYHWTAKHKLSVWPGGALWAGVDSMDGDETDQILGTALNSDNTAKSSAVFQLPVRPGGFAPYVFAADGVTPALQVALL